jgi:hypothetical protein
MGGLNEDAGQAKQPPEVADVPDSMRSGRHLGRGMMGVGPPDCGSARTSPGWSNALWRRLRRRRCTHRRPKVRAARAFRLGHWGSDAIGEAGRRPAGGARPPAPRPGRATVTGRCRASPARRGYRLAGSSLEPLPRSELTKIRQRADNYGSIARRRGRSEVARLDRSPTRRGERQPGVMPRWSGGQTPTWTALGPMTRVVAHVAEEVGADDSLGETPLPVLAVEAVVVAAAGYRLQGEVRQ